MIRGNTMSLYHARLSNGRQTSLSATSLNLAWLLFQRQLPDGTSILFVYEHQDDPAFCWN
jgi:hypothetical protein